MISSCEQNIFDIWLWQPSIKYVNEYIYESAVFYSNAILSNAAEFKPQTARGDCVEMFNFYETSSKQRGNVDCRYS